MMLGDLGADVLKVERPGTGDESRGWGPPFDARGESAYYLSANRNKLSVAIDLDDPRDRQFLRDLAASADVAVDNFRRGALERRGIGARDLLSLNPNLLWCSITGFGAANDRPGYDFVAQAEAGWMSITGDPSGDPMKTGVALADVIAGKDAAVLIVAALAAHARGTLGASVEARHFHVSLAHSATAALVNVAQNVLVSGKDAGRWGNAHANLCPYELFPTADRPIVIAVGSDAQWIACARALGLDDLAQEDRLRTNAARVAERVRIVAQFTAVLRTKPATVWIDALNSASVPCGVVRSVTEALTDVVTSPLTGVQPLRPGRVRFPPPRLDEHGSLVREQGWGVFARVGVRGSGSVHKP
jgi:crotonobetainyl-CoA:carnitine CoA-transferase CaiB-like acyl-CoA transferase